MNELNVLMIDDDEKLTNQYYGLLNDEVIKGYRLKVECINDFDKAKELWSERDYDLIVLDVFKGKPGAANKDRPGEEILEIIKETCFTTVIFFTGLPSYVEHLESDIIRVVGKEKLLQGLTSQIEYVISTGIPLIRKKLSLYLKESMREYFWDFVHKEWKTLSAVKDDVSLGYLLVRRLAKSLSKEHIRKLLEDEKISHEKVHPMEFYIYPPFGEDYETGDILEKGGEFFVLLTPSCDLVLREGERTAETIMLASCISLNETEEYKDYKKSNSRNNTNKLRRLVESKKSNRYFFLPGTPFMKHYIIDFQKIVVIESDDLDTLSRIARLDDPFAQSMLSSFIRYYNRIGYPDIDSDYILKNLK